MYLWRITRVKIYVDISIIVGLRSCALRCIYLWHLLKNKNKTLVHELIRVPPSLISYHLSQIDLTSTLKLQRKWPRFHTAYHFIYFVTMKPVWMMVHNNKLYPFYYYPISLNHFLEDWIADMKAVLGTKWMKTWHKSWNCIYCRLYTSLNESKILLRI